MLEGALGRGANAHTRTHTHTSRLVASLSRESRSTFLEAGVECVRCGVCILSSSSQAGGKVKALWRPTPIHLSGHVIRLKVSYPHRTAPVCVLCWTQTKALETRNRRNISGATSQPQPHALVAGVQRERLLALPRQRSLSLSLASQNINDCPLCHSTHDPPSNSFYRFCFKKKDKKKIGGDSWEIYIWVRATK